MLNISLFDNYLLKMFGVYCYSFYFCISKNDKLQKENNK